MASTTNPLFQGKTLLNLNPLTLKQSIYLKKVYTLMLAGVLTAIVACIYGPEVPPSMGFLCQIALIFYISGSKFREPSFLDPTWARPSAFLLMSGMIGAMLKPLIALAQFLDPQLVYTAGIASLCVFLCLSIASVLNFKSRTFLYMGSSIASLTLYVSLIRLANWWFRSRFVLDMVSLVEFGLTLSYVLYDTQVALACAEVGEDDVVGHALQFFMNLVQLFQRILIKLMESSAREIEERENKKRRN